MGKDCVKNDFIVDVWGFVRIDPSTNQRYIEIEKCPFCGQKHIHGLGLLGDGPLDKFLDVRLSHCDDAVLVSSYCLRQLKFK